MKIKIKIKEILIFISLVIVTISSIFFITSCSKSRINANFDQQIVSAINNIKDYQVDIYLKTEKKQVLDLINYNFIKNKLDDKNKTIFDGRRFKLIKIVNKDHSDLSENEFSSVKKINAKVFYQYGNIQHQEVNLLINIIASEKQIVEKINAQNYSFQADLNMKKADLIAKISDPAFIKEQLDENLRASFVDEWYVFNNVTKKNELEEQEELKDDDFKISQIIIAQIDYDYNLLKNETTKLTLNIKASAEQIIKAIGANTYYQEGILNSKAIHLEETITERFIKDGLENNFKNSFVDGAFVLNKVLNQNQEELKDEDLTVAGKIHAIINYDYGELTNLTTNLIINIEQIRLKYFFNKFQFIDTRASAIENMTTVSSHNINGFLDHSGLEVITSQILSFLNIPSLESADLILENQTSNSIVLKALPSSQNYQGEVTLTWNLKLFEIYGASILTKDEALKTGLKGYVYLEKETKKIKFFDVFCFLLGFSRPIINENCQNYHSFYFFSENHEEKKVIFDNIKSFSEIAREFDSFIFVPELKITVFSQDYTRIKIFNFDSNEWINLDQETSFSIDGLGNLIILN